MKINIIPLCDKIVQEINESRPNDRAMALKQTIDYLLRKAFPYSDLERTELNDSFKNMLIESVS